MNTNKIVAKLDQEIEDTRRLRDIVAQLPTHLPGEINAIGSINSVFIDVETKAEWKTVRHWFGANIQGKTFLPADWDGEHTWVYKWGNVKLHLSLVGDGKTCRKVQVGTRTTEMPVYELVCD